MLDVLFYWLKVKTQKLYIMSISNNDIGDNCDKTQNSSWIVSTVYFEQFQRPNHIFHVVETILFQLCIRKT